MTMSLGRNTQQENPSSSIESRSLPASFVEKSAEKQQQLDFCHVPQGDDLGPRKSKCKLASYIVNYMANI